MKQFFMASILVIAFAALAATLTSCSEDEIAAPEGSAIQEAGIPSDAALYFDGPSKRLSFDGPSKRK